ncbi:hypothetical protein ACOL3F_11785, partial [Aliarcobacter butzleri]
NKLETILNEYIELIYDNPNESPLLINYVCKDKRVYKKYGKEIQSEYLNKKIFKLKNIIDSLTIIENLDYRLVYYFLKKYYGNNKLKKILW